MHFLYPTFLWAGLAVAIPLIIHLFNFRRTKKVFFTNVAFLKAVKTTTSSFRRLKQLLIMAARMAFILSLVLAFSQPFLPSKNGRNVNAGGLSSIYLDNSLSMQNELDKKSYLDKAVAKTEELLTAFPQGARLQLLTNDFSADEHRVGNVQQIKERTTSIGYTHTPRTFENVLKRQMSLAGKHNSQGGNQYFWFSDFQRSTAGDLNKIKIDSSSRLYLVPVQAKSTQNVFVDSVWLNTPFVREMQSNVLTVKLFNTGEQPVENLQVKLFIDEIQVSSEITSIPAKSSGQARFSFNVKDKGFKKGRISFDDTPITFDNDYYFVLNAAPSIEILHLFGQSSGSKYIQTVFANDSIFSFKSFSALNVDVGLLKSANLIVLEGVQSIEGSMKSALQEFVGSGGSLLVIPSQNPDLSSYNAFAAGLNIRNIQSRNITESDFSPLAEPVKSSSFFMDIFDNSTKKEMIQMPEQGGVLTWQTIGEKLLSFRNNQPFLTQTKINTAKVYWLASPLDPQFGDFARNALFVPIMYKIAALSVRQEPTAYSFKENSFSVEVKDALKNAVYKLRRGKLELIPVQNLVGKQLTIELPKANQLNDNQEVESGYYELLLNGKVEKLLAFNHDSKESMMDFYGENELKKIFSNQKNVQVFDKIDDDNFIRNFKEQNFGVALWKYFLIAALVFLAIEIAIVRFMKG